MQLPPIKGVAKIMFSAVSVCPPVGWLPCNHYSPYIGSPYIRTPDMLKLVQHGPYYTGTCSNLFFMKYVLLPRRRLASYWNAFFLIDHHFCIAKNVGILRNDIYYCTNHSWVPFHTKMPMS